MPTEHEIAEAQELGVGYHPLDDEFYEEPEDCPDFDEEEDFDPESVPDEDEDVDPVDEEYEAYFGVVDSDWEDYYQYDFGEEGGEEVESDCYVRDYGGCCSECCGGSCDECDEEPICECSSCGGRFPLSELTLLPEVEDWAKEVAKRAVLGHGTPQPPEEHFLGAKYGYSYKAMFCNDCYEAVIANQMD